MLHNLTADSLSASFLFRSLTRHDQRPHLLLDCSRLEVECILLGLKQWGTGPFTHCRLPGALQLPKYRRGTLLLEGMHFLNMTQQIALYDWMTHAPRDLQIISLTTSTIDSLVANGHFLEALFYRLNVVRLNLRVQDAAVASSRERQ